MSYIQQVNCCHCHCLLYSVVGVETMLQMTVVVVVEFVENSLVVIVLKPLLTNRHRPILQKKSENHQWKFK